jgi:hypothetical protein
MLQTPATFMSKCRKVCVAAQVICGSYAAASAAADVDLGFAAHLLRR